MQILKAVAKVEKRLQKKMSRGSYNDIYSIIYQGQELSFFENGSRDGTGSVSCIHLQREGAVSRPEIDHFPGHYCDNIEQALSYLKPKPGKFSLGSLVRFKDNKRNYRYGKRSGFVGIVSRVRSHGYYNVKLCPSFVKEISDVSERDIEKVEVEG